MARFTERERWQFAGTAIVSAVVMLACLFVILKGSYPDAITKWAFGMMGLVVGYWLR
jgi:uncharacterized membrane protein